MARRIIPSRTVNTFVITSKTILNIFFAVIYLDVSFMVECEETKGKNRDGALGTVYTVVLASSFTLRC